MNRSLWTQTLTKSYCPPWPCPICKMGTLSLDHKSLIHEETVDSVRAHKSEDFDPEWIEYSFTAWAQCNHARCKQKFSIAGKGSVGRALKADDDWTWEDYYSPRFCHPMPHIIELPKKCPEDIVIELEAAFNLFWIHPAACAGRIRVSLELLMNHIGVPKRKKNNNGRFTDLNLHARVAAFAARESVVGANLMALKWLGNTGSHDGQVSKGDLLDAFEILEHSLKEILDRRSAHVAQLAKKLLKKHRP